MTQYTIRVNKETRKVDEDPDAPLLYILRNNLGLHGPKFGCGLGQCGACTVHLDGEPIRSCTMPVSAIGQRHITTLEGLTNDGEPGRVQKAFIEEQALQCGYCCNGMIMTSAALLNKNPKPTLDEVKNALAGNLCRCGTYQRICAAVVRASIS